MVESEKGVSDIWIPADGPEWLAGTSAILSNITSYLITLIILIHQEHVNVLWVEVLVF